MQLPHDGMCPYVSNRGQVYSHVVEMLTSGFLICAWVLLCKAAAMMRGYNFVGTASEMCACYCVMRTVCACERESVCVCV